MRRPILFAIGITLLGVGCFYNPPTTLEEIRNANVDMPIQDEKKTEDIFSSDSETTAKTPEGVPPLPGIFPSEELQGKRVRMVTSKGVIVFTLLGDEAPLAASNFIWLAGHKFYDGLTFHRVVPGFVIQGGDPRGDGSGGPGYTFVDEPVKRPYLAGTVAMANAGPNTNGSQFFIMLEDNATLPPNYTIFGLVTEGLNVVREIRVGDTIASVRIE